MPPTTRTGWGFRIGLITALLGVAVLPVWALTPDPYIATQLAYSYEIGFLPRGFWGTLISLVGLMPGAVMAAALVGYLAVTALAAWAIGRATTGVERPWSTTRLFVGLAVLVSPAGLPFLAANLGRLDTPMLLFGGLALVTLWAGRGGTLLPLAFLVAAILTHEGALLAVAPLVVALAWHVRGAIPALVLAGGAVLTTAMVAVAGMPVPMDTFATWLGDRVGRPDPFAIILPYQDLSDGFARGVDHLRRIGLSGVVRDALVPVLPVLVLCALAWRDGEVRWAALTTPQRMMVVTTASPLLLSLVGTDLGRWWAITAIQMTVVTLHLLPRPTRTSLPTVVVGLAAVITTFLVGPVTI